MSDPSFIVSDPSIIVDQIYEAAVLPELWAGLLDDLAVASKREHGIIFSVMGPDVRFVTSSERYRRDATEFFALYPDNQRTGRLLAKPKAGFIADADLFTREENETLPVYRDFFIPRGYGDGVATVIPMPGGETVIIHLEGPYRRHEGATASVPWLDSMRPHLARSAMLSARLGFERARTAVQTLEALGFAACAVRLSGAVILANPQFDAETDIWTTRAGERIALLSKPADALLGDALRMIGRDAGVRSIPLRGGPETAPAILHVVPVRRAAHDLFGQAIAILVLTKASSEPTGRTSLLQALFDLSPTEAVIAARIAAGQSVEEIARTDAKSAETVRNQLKSVLAKTGCRRQVDLARMLAQMLGS